MNSRLFGRHTRACVDAALHCVFQSTSDLPAQRCLLQQLLAVLRERSHLMARAPTPLGTMLQIDLLRNLLPFVDHVVRDPSAWPGADGHPLNVAASLASHLFGLYPTPRFMAASWFAGPAEHRQWAVALGQGVAVSCLGIPITLTRRMRHLFLQSPDHLPIVHALRRAEVLGLGGTPHLVAQLLTTRLGEDFEDPVRWRVALQWLVQCGQEIEPLHVGPLIDFLRANLATVELRGRTFASVMRMVRAWHGVLAQRGETYRHWPPSRLPGFALAIPPTLERPRPAEWLITELLDSNQLAHESHSMRHCVASYASACAGARSSIWSLRHRWTDDFATRSVLTIEVRLKTKTIVQIRGTANASATSSAMHLVQQWARTAGLRMEPSA